MGLFTKKLFASGQTAFGLDISDLMVKVASAQSDGNVKKVVSFGFSKIPAGVIVESVVKNKQVVAESIRQALAQAGPSRIRTKKAVCSLPETKAFIRIVAVPRMNEDEMHEAIKWEIEANIPMDIEDVYYDWRRSPFELAEEKNKDHVLIVAVARTVVDQYIEIAEMAGLEVVGLEIESIAQARSLISLRETGKTTMIVDLGGRRTSFLVLIGDAPCFTSSIPVAGRSLTDAMSKSLDMTVEEAEKMKVKYGIGSYVKNDPLFRAVEPIVGSLVAEIRKTIDFYLMELKYSASIDELIICGGTANSKGLLAYLSKELQREVKLGDPWVNFSQDEKVRIIDRASAVQYSTALGLALRGVDYYEDIY